MEKKKTKTHEGKTVEEDRKAALNSQGGDRTGQGGPSETTEVSCAFLFFRGAGTLAVKDTSSLQDQSLSALQEPEPTKERDVENSSNQSVVVFLACGWELPACQ